MKLPKEIVTRHKIRDFRICRLYSDEHKTSNEIGGIFEITGRQVRNILYKNREFLQIDKNWEKTKQIHRVRRQIAGKKESRKDVADLEELLRKIMEGEKSLVDQSQHIQIINYGQSTNSRERVQRLDSPVAVRDTEKV